jgi:hypothetical protein
MNGRQLLHSAIAALLLLGATACGSGETTGQSPATSTTAPGVSTSTVPATPTTPTTPTTAAIADACGAGARPAAAVRVSEAPGDFDGDGQPDVLVTYGLGTDASPEPWHLRLEPATGNPIDVELPSPVAPVPVQALGGTDLSGDGTPEPFAVVAGGTSLLLVGVFQLGLCTLTRVTGPDGQPSALPVEAEANHRRGIRCDGARVFTRTADSDDGVTFRTGEGRLRFSGAALVPDGAPALGTLTSPADDAAIASYSTIDCPGVVTPAAPTG